MNLDEENNEMKIGYWVPQPEFEKTIVFHSYFLKNSKLQKRL